MTRTAANGPSVGTSNASAQNPVDRQVGEAVERVRKAQRLPRLSDGTDWAANREDILATLDHLEQVTRERDEAVRLLRPFAEAAGSLDDNHRDRGAIWESPAAMIIDAGELRAAEAFLASLRSMENG